MDLCFAVNNLEFLSNTGKVQFEGLVHLLIYIREINNLGLKYCSKIEDAPLSDLLVQARIKTENKFMVLSHYIWQDFPDTGRSTGVFIMFYQGGPIDHYTNVPGPVSQSSADIENNAVWTAGMALEYLRIINDELLNKDTDVVQEQTHLIILDIKSAICMSKNGKDTKHTRRISRRMNFVKNGE